MFMHPDASFRDAVDRHRRILADGRSPAGPAEAERAGRNPEGRIPFLSSLFRI